LTTKSRIWVEFILTLGAVELSRSSTGETVDMTLGTDSGMREGVGVFVVSDGRTVLHTGQVTWGEMVVICTVITDSSITLFAVVLTWTT
jgi:hypothetical protein